MHKQKKTSRRLILAFGAALACFAGALHMTTDRRNKSEDTFNQIKYSSRELSRRPDRKGFASREPINEQGFGKRRRPSLAEKAAEQYEIRKLIRRSQELPSEPVTILGEGTILYGSLVGCVRMGGCSRIVSADDPLFTIAISRDDLSGFMRFRLKEINDNGIVISSDGQLLMSELEGSLFVPFNETIDNGFLNMRIRAIRKIGENTAGIELESMDQPGDIEDFEPVGQSDSTELLDFSELKIISKPFTPLEE